MEKKSTFTLLFLVALSVFLISNRQTYARNAIANKWQEFYPNSLSDDNIIEATGAICQLCHAYEDGGEP